MIFFLVHGLVESNWGRLYLFFNFLIKDLFFYQSLYLKILSWKPNPQNVTFHPLFDFFIHMIDVSLSFDQHGSLT